MPSTKPKDQVEYCEKLSLRGAVDLAIIVAHREDTSPLENALHSEGFNVCVVRGPYTTKQLQFCSQMKCLVNHSNAWSIAASLSRGALIVEADFVPVKGMGSFPVPAPYEKPDDSLGYAYSVAPQVWDSVRLGLCRGHAGGMVALFVPSRVAQLMLEFFREEVARNPEGSYSPWDSKIGYWLKQRGVESYIPLRHYGEHGGIPNPEHAKAGLGRPHQADVLAGQLLFLPAYARGSQFRYRVLRVRALSWGLIRLVCGRLAAPYDLRRSKSTRLLKFLTLRFLPGLYIA